jgi:hypothetical protein
MARAEDLPGFARPSCINSAILMIALSVRAIAVSSQGCFYRECMAIFNTGDGSLMKGWKKIPPMLP